MKLKFNPKLFINYYTYFLELKFKIIYILIMWIITTFTCYVYKYQLLFVLSKYILIIINSNKFFYSNVTQLFVTYIEISMYIAFLIIIPFIILKFMSFFFNMWYNFEYKIFLKFYFIFLITYIIGFFINQYYFIPNILNFFLKLNQNNIYFTLHFEAKFDKYFFLILNLLFKLNCLFQIPLIIFFLQKIDILNETFFIKQKKYIYIFFLFISAFVSPPELFNQLGFFFCLSCCVELIIFINIFIKIIFK